jgi:hypothetical protein
MTPCSGRIAAKAVDKQNIRISHRIAAGLRDLVQLRHLSSLPFALPCE